MDAGYFGLSLCIETLKLLFRLGVCEITDLALNTVGGFGGGFDECGGEEGGGASLV